MNTSNTKKSTKETIFAKSLLSKTGRIKDESKLMFNAEVDKKEDSLKNLMKDQSLVFENLFQQ